MDKRKIGKVYKIRFHRLIKESCLFFLWGALFFLVSCTETSEGNGKALVNIRLIDGPGDFDGAWIEILGVEILQGRSRESNDAHWVFVEYQQPNKQIDISKLVGGGVLLLGRTEVPVGLISKIKLILGDEHSLTKDGKAMSLTLDSSVGSEVELDVEYDLESSFSYDVYLDFDLDRSIQGTEDATRFLLSPMVRSFVRYQTSEVGGKIKPVEASPVIYAIQDSDTLTTLTNSSGEYLFMGLKEGKHTLVVHPREPYLDTLFSIETELGKLTAIEEILLKTPVVE